MDTAKDTPAEQHRMEKEDIEDLGTVTLSRGGHVIHCLTVIGRSKGTPKRRKGKRPLSTSTSSPSWWRCRRTPASRGCWCC